jgi:hypothetical protein
MAASISAFMNDVVVPWCREQKIEVTRSRAYKKNDQAFVEQKNGAVVRRLVGYGRFDGVETARVMARLYAAARLHGTSSQRDQCIASTCVLAPVTGRWLCRAVDCAERLLTRLQSACPARHNADNARTACLRCQPVVAVSSSRMRPFSCRPAAR